MSHGKKRTQRQKGKGETPRHEEGLQGTPMTLKDGGREGVGGGVDDHQPLFQEKADHDVFLRRQKVSSSRFCSELPDLRFSSNRRWGAGGASLLFLAKVNASDRPHSRTLSFFMCVSLGPLVFMHASLPLSLSLLFSISSCL